MRINLIMLFFLCFAFHIEAKSQTYRVILEPRFQTKISSEVTSTVVAIHKKMGESFVKDELLLELDDHLFKTNYNKAVAVKENTQTNLNTMQELFNEQSASMTQLSEAKASNAIAQAELALAEKALNACLIKAPYAGKVQELLVEEFERVEAGKEMMSIIDDTVLIAKLLVDAELLSELRVGKKLSVEIPLIKEKFDAEITYIAAGVNPASGLIKVDAQINNEKALLKAGMFGIVHIEKFIPEPAPKPIQKSKSEEKIPAGSSIQPKSF